MSPTLLIEPALLSIPGIAKSSEEVEGIFNRVISWSRAVRYEGGVRICILENTTKMLAECNLYPAQNNIQRLISDHNLSHVFSANDIQRMFNEILGRALAIEEITEIVIIETTNYTSSPDVSSSYNHMPDVLRMACDETLAHMAVSYAKENKWKDLLRGAFACGATGPISVAFRLEGCIEPGSLTPPLDLEESPITVKDMEDLYLTYSPRSLWRYAEDNIQIKFAIELMAKQLASVAKGAARFGLFSIGERFVESLAENGAYRTGPMAGVVLDTCAQVVAKTLTKKKVPFERNDEQIIRDDGARAWRVHLTKGHEAMRLMYWELIDGTIELANIGPKNELRIH